MTPGLYQLDPGKSLVELPEGHCGVLWVFRSRQARGSLKGVRPSPARHFPPLWLVLMGLALSCAAWWMGHGAP